MYLDLKKYRVISDISLVYTMNKLTNLTKNPQLKIKCIACI